MKPTKVKDITGQRFGKLVVTEFSYVDKFNRSWWNCQCDCGYSIVTRSGQLRTTVIKSTRSYGCLKRERLVPFGALYTALKHCCLTRKIPLKLSLEEFQEFTKITSCHYCTKDISWTKYSIATHNAKYNLDRIHNDIEYTKENCVVCCSRCNYAKGNRYTYFEWYKMTEPFRTGELKHEQAG